MTLGPGADGVVSPKAYWAAVALTGSANPKALQVPLVVSEAPPPSKELATRPDKAEAYGGVGFGCLKAKPILACRWATNRDERGK